VRALGNPRWFLIVEVVKPNWAASLPFCRGIARPRVPPGASEYQKGGRMRYITVRLVGGLTEEQERLIRVVVWIILVILTAVPPLRQM
jgi:hypothetical protein